MKRVWRPKQYFTPVKEEEIKVNKYCSNCKHASDYKDNLSISGEVIFITCPYDDDIPNQNPSIYPIKNILKLKNSHICSHWE